jgi:hypothetical protein
MTLQAPALHRTLQAPTRQSFARRFTVPVLTGLLILALLYLLNSDLVRIEDVRLYRAFRNLALIGFYAGLWLGPALYVYPRMFFRGASVRERLLGAYLVPVAYILSEVVRVTEFFTLGESIYYAFSTMGLLTLSLQAGFLGLSEMVCRLALRRQTRQPVRVVTFWPVAGLLFMLAAIYILVLWGMGVHWFYIYQEGYKLLFDR